MIMKKSHKMKLKEFDILLYSLVKFYCTLSGLNLSNLNCLKKKYNYYL